MSFSYIITCWRITLIMAPPRKKKEEKQDKKPHLTSLTWEQLQKNQVKNLHHVGLAVLLSHFAFVPLRIKCKKSIFMCFKECFLHFKMVSHYRREMDTNGKRRKNGQRSECKIAKKYKKKKQPRNPHLAPLCALFPCNFASRGMDLAAEKPTLLFNKQNVLRCEGPEPQCKMQIAAISCQLRSSATASYPFGCLLNYARQRKKSAFCGGTTKGPRK